MLVGAKWKKRLPVLTQKNTGTTKTTKAKTAASSSPFRFFLPLVAGIYLIKSFLSPGIANAQEKADTLFFDETRTKIHVIANGQDTTMDVSKRLPELFGFSSFPEGTKKDKIAYDNGPQWNIFAPGSKMLSVFISSKTGLITGEPAGPWNVIGEPLTVQEGCLKGAYAITASGILISAQDKVYKAKFPCALPDSLLQGSTLKYKWSKKHGAYCVFFSAPLLKWGFKFVPNEAGGSLKGDEIMVNKDIKLKKLNKKPT